METPSEKLATNILNRLVEDGLARESQLAKLVPKLADGKLRADDWRLEVELSNRDEDEDE